MTTSSDWPFFNDPDDVETQYIVDAGERLFEALNKHRSDQIDCPNLKKRACSACLQWYDDSYYVWRLKLEVEANPIIEVVDDL